MTRRPDTYDEDELNTLFPETRPDDIRVPISDKEETDPAPFIPAREGEE